MIDTARARQERIVMLLENAKLHSRCWGTVPLQNKRPSEDGVYEMERPEFDEFAWFVGLFEGEGTAQASKQRWKGGKARYLYLQIGMTDEDVVRRAHSAIGLGSVRGPYVRGGNKPLWFWGAYGQNAMRIAFRLLPHVGRRRREQIEHALDVIGYPTKDQTVLEVE